jgi:hypothetical protein
MTDGSPYEISHITWQGIEIEIRFARDWLGSSKTAYPTAHIEVETVNPQRTALPITDTGYRSHFLTAENVDAAGGAVAYVLEALAEASAHPEWQAKSADQKQLTLF